MLTGTKLGPYEVLEKIGAGGMGEVYRARDTRLGREVAIKVLPAALVTDAARLERFEQEARAAGMLNHPNILSIYDIGSHDGVPYVVSELLEGETLRARLGGAALPVRKAVELAVQIAHGLSAAHEKGITHRDLKPENLFITRDGRVKILDFGLAKLTQTDAENSAFTNLPTTPVHTDPGIILGTAAYMSPEQVRGQAADHRSDLFAFGAILYEMLTGLRAFSRDSAVETMSAILKEDPPEISATGSRLPPGLERIVRHCLEKNPEERFQSARDLAFDLQSHSGSSEMPAATSRAVAAVSSPRKALLTAAIAIVALAVVAVAAYLAGARSSSRAAGKKVDFQVQTFRRGFVDNALFTPDGESFVFGGAWEGKPSEIYMKRPDSPESRSLGMENAVPLAVSRSGEMAILLNRRIVLGWTQTGTLARVSLSGGAPREVAENVEGADWSPDGAQLLAAVYTPEGGARLEMPLGKVLYTSTGWVSHPRFSRDGARIAFVDHDILGDDRGLLQVLDLKSGKSSKLTKTHGSMQGLAWSPDDRRILFTAADVGNRLLRSVDLSGAERIVLDIPASVTLHDVAADGRILLTTNILRRGIIVSARGEAQRDLSWLDWSSPQSLTPDGQWLLFEEQATGAGNEFYAMYLRRTDGSPAIHLGEGHARDLSADGKWALVVQDKPSRHLVLLPVGPGAPREIPGTEIAVPFGHALVPGGKRVVFTGQEAGRGTRIYQVDLETGKRSAITPEGVSPAVTRVSADGKWVALNDAKGGIAVYPMEGGSPRLFSVQGATHPLFPEAFTPDGSGLYVAEPGETHATVTLLDLASGNGKPWKQLSTEESAGFLDYGPVLVAPDGRSYVYSYRQWLSTLYLTEGLEKPGS
ncbi:MAG TPA: protein kinase [Thermoanaerobaculia bacterium]|nr:protein kinase [Thermoanaerobaculia bacterium]